MSTPIFEIRAQYYFEGPDIQPTIHALADNFSYKTNLHIISTNTVADELTLWQQKWSQ